MVSPLFVVAVDKPKIFMELMQRSRCIFGDFDERCNKPWPIDVTDIKFWDHHRMVNAFKKAQLIDVYRFQDSKIAWLS
jgi:hypothetical protein